MVVSRWDQIRNDSILESTDEVHTYRYIADQVRHTRFRWFGHVMCMDTNVNYLQQAERKV